jgi:anti-sigma B factor antagonist
MQDQEIRRAPAIVRLPAEIDISNVQHVLALLHAVYAAGATVVVADLTATVFCDTTGLHALMKVQRQASADGAQLRLAVSPGGPVHRVLEMMGVDRLMPVYTSRDDAVALVRPGETALIR